MPQPSLITQIFSYIDQNLDQKLTLEKIAKALHYSKFYLARTFKKHTGMTIGSYIQDRRLEEAAAKLEETEKPIVEIALEAGYGSQQAFTTGFRRRYLCTPQEYRKKHVETRMGGRTVRILFLRRKGRLAA